MPIVKVYGDTNWMPGLFMFLNQTPPEQDHAEFRVTEQLLHILPRMVAETISQIDEVSLKSGEVLVLPHVMHPWTHNGLNFWFDVQCGDGGLADEPEEIRRERRRAIRAELNRRLVGFFRARSREHPYKFPTFDLEIRPLSGTGYSVDALGEVAHQRG